MGELGVRCARYGIPWHRISPTRSAGMAFAGRALERLLDSASSRIVDLVHYGLPAWIENAFLNPDFPQLHGGICGSDGGAVSRPDTCLTPLNEPRITAWYCGKLGWWPPYRRGWRGFAGHAGRLPRHRGERACAQRGRSEIVPCARRRDRPLRSGRRRDFEVEARAAAGDRLPRARLDQRASRRGHAAVRVAARHGATEADLDGFAARAVNLDVIGINLYPMFSQKRLVRDARGLRISACPMRCGAIVERLSALSMARYGALS